jgi:hypothetical protein
MSELTIKDKIHQEIENLSIDVLNEIHHFGEVRDFDEEYECDDMNKEELIKSLKKVVVKHSDITLEKLKGFKVFDETRQKHTECLSLISDGTGDVEVSINSSSRSFRFDEHSIYLWWSDLVLGFSRELFPYEETYNEDDEDD